MLHTKLTPSTRLHRLAFWNRYYENRVIDGWHKRRVLTRHWARRTNRPYYGIRVWRVFSQEAS